MSSLQSRVLELPDRADTTPELDLSAPVQPCSLSVPGTDLPATIGGFQVLEELARGSTGVVLRVYDPDLRRSLAVKMLRPDLREDTRCHQRFLEEAQITAQLQHPGIAPVHQTGRLADGRPWFAMKLVEGRTLAELLDNRGSLAEDRDTLVSAFFQAARAMAHAHASNVIHRDLKPANILVSEADEVCVLDWGLARVLHRPWEQGGDDAPALPVSEISTVRTDGPGTLTEVGAVSGTYAYMAPEQAQGSVTTLDARADVFALGAILCEILTGEPPYVADTRAETYEMAANAELIPAMIRLYQSKAPEHLVQLASECLATMPEDRPRDARVVAKWPRA